MLRLSRPIRPSRLFNLKPARVCSCGQTQLCYVVVDSYSKLPSDHQLPCLIQSTLRQSTSEPHADTYDAEESFLRLIVCHGFETRCRYTKIVSHSEKCELVATKTHLVADFSTGATANSRKESEEKAGQSNSEGERDTGQSPSAENDSTTAPTSDVTSGLEPKTGGDPTIQSLNVAREPVDGPKDGDIYDDIDLTCFSQLPCFLCQQDALDPEVSGKARTHWFLTEGHSIAYTCQRCNDRTWISRYTRGLLPAVVGRWSLTRPRRS